MPTPLLTFAPGVNPSLDLDDDHEYPVEEYPAIKPYVQVLPMSLRPVRVMELPWIGLTQAQVEYFLSFFREIHGPGGVFLWTPPDPVESPHRGPDLEEVTQAGAPGSPRTYFVRYGWYDPTSGQESRPSPASQITVAGGKLLRLTAPVMPNGVTAMRIYAGTIQDSEELQDFISARVWTEPLGGLITGSPPPPTSNNLRPALRWRLLGKTKPRKRTANRYDLTTAFAEQHV